MADVRSIADLKPDSQNARRHNPRNIGMIRQALGEVGAARSIVIDEQGTVLAGNGVLEAAADAGIERVQVVDADGETIIAVRRKGLTPEQKKRLAYFDNAANDLSEWEPLQIAADMEAGFDFSGLFDDKELTGILADAANDLLKDERDAKQDGQEPEDVEPKLELTRADVPDALWPTDIVRVSLRGRDGRQPVHNTRIHRGHTGQWRHYHDHCQARGL